MALKTFINSIRKRLEEIVVTNGDGLSTLLFVRVWNNQVELLNEGSIEAIPMPCAFIELDTTGQPHGNIGRGVCEIQTTLRIHLINEHYNTESSFEQNLDIYTLRQAVIRKLNRYKTNVCSPMFKFSESQDYDHTNLYHYIIEFSTMITDTTGSDIDTLNEDVIDSTPPLTLEILINNTKRLPH